MVARVCLTELSFAMRLDQALTLYQNFVTVSAQLARGRYVIIGPIFDRPILEQQDRQTCSHIHALWSKNNRQAVLLR